MKRYLITLFLYLLITPLSFNFCNAQAEVPVGAPGVPQLGDKELEVLNEWAKVLEGFSEEELEELANIGEMYMKELEDQGVDPMEFLFHEDSPIWEKPPVFDQEPKPEEPIKETVPTPEPVPFKVPDEPTETKVLTLTDKEKIKAFKHKLEDIADKIGSLRQKAESKRSLSEKLHPFELALSDITYYVLTIKEDHLLKYLFEKKFESLYALLIELHQALETYEPQIYVTEFSLEGEDPYMILDVNPSASFETIYQQYQNLMREENPFTIEARLKEQREPVEVIEKKVDTARKRWNKIIWAYEALQAKENSKHAFETLLNVIQEMLYKHNLIAKLKELLRAYDPEALKMKEEQEAKEKKAREEQERLARQRPPWTQPVFAAAPSVRDRYPYDNSATSGWNGGFDYDMPGFEGMLPTSDTPPAGKGAPEDKKQTRFTQTDQDKKPTKPDKGKRDKKKPSLEVPPAHTETDRKIFRIKDAFDAIKTILTDNQTLTSDIKSYLTKPYKAADNKTALKINQLLTSVAQGFTSLEKMINEDLKKLKDIAAAKKRYVQSVSKAYKAFKDDDKVKKSLETLNSFAMQDNNITYKNELIQANPIKRFLIAGVPVAEAERARITPELQTINNPLTTRGVTTQENVNHIENYNNAYTNLDKLMKKTFIKEDK